MRIKRMSHLIVAAMIVAAVPATASATITQVFSSRADFVAGTSGLTSLNFDLGAGTYTAPDYTVGSLTISAPSANVFGTGNIVSTDLDSNALLLTFATPVTALGLYGGVTDEFLNYVDGTLSVVVNGGPAISLTATGGSAAYLGFISDVAISQVELSIASFDVNATSTAFTTLEQQADLASAGDVSAGVPEPSTWMMLVVGFGGMGAALRRKTQPALTIVGA